MKRFLQKGMALLVALMMLLMPLLASAEETQTQPGDLLPQLVEKALAAGRAVRGDVKLSLSSAAPLDEQYLTAVNQVLDGLVFSVTYMTLGQVAYAQVEVNMQKTRIATVDMQIAQTGVLLATSLMPGKVFALPLAIEGDKPLFTSISPMSMFTLPIPNFAVGGVELSDEELEFIFGDIGNYLYKIANWVSKTQDYRGDLYINQDVEIEETETRDYVARTMDAKVYPEDLKVLLRSLADTLYDDAQLQKIMTRYAKAMGDTAQDVQDFANELPLAVSKLKPTQTPTDFTYFYDDFGDVVGFEGVMPRMFDKFPFDNGTLKYDRLTTFDGVTHKAHGTITLGGDELVGNLNVFDGLDAEGLLLNEAGMDLTYTQDGNVSAKASGFYEVKRYYADGAEVITPRFEMHLSDARGTYGTQVDISADSHTETRPQGDQDFTSQTQASLLFKFIQETGTDLGAQLNAQVTLTSGPAVPPTLSGTRIELADLSTAELMALAPELYNGGMMALLNMISLLPPELMQQVVK